MTCSSQCHVSHGNRRGRQLPCASAQGDQGYGHPIASSYASSVTGASAFDDALAAAAAAEARSPVMDRQRSQLDEALAHMGTVEVMEWCIVSCSAVLRMTESHVS